MILVDSSILVAYLRGDDDDPVAMRFAEVLDRRIPFGIEPHVYQEVLQGARSEKEWESLEAYLSGQHMYGLRQGAASYREAARIYYDCRRRGFTVRSLVDCLVAQTVLEHGLLLLAHDRDYRSICRVRELRLWA